MTTRRFIVACCLAALGTPPAAAQVADTRTPPGLGGRSLEDLLAVEVNTVSPPRATSSA